MAIIKLAFDANSIFFPISDNGVNISLKLITAKSWSGAPRREAAKLTALTPGKF